MTNHMTVNENRRVLPGPGGLRVARVRGELLVRGAKGVVVVYLASLPK